MKKNFAILLPYKEQYTRSKSAAAAIWVKDYIKNSKFKKKTIIFGNLENKIDKPLTKNFINLDISKVIINRNRSYTKKFLKYCNKNNFDVIEIHNRPESLIYLIKSKLKSKFIFVFHNNPQDLRYSKTVKEREFILKKCDQIFFVSKWVMNKFFEGLSVSYNNNCEVLYPAINKLKKFPKKEKLIIFTGKLNHAKGYDIFGQSCLKVLKKFSNWNAIAIGNEKRESYNFEHPNYKVLDWLPHEKIMRHYKKSSIAIVCSRWQEPFGRTAMEAAASGCATIISKRGGLEETFNAKKLIIDKLNVNKMVSLISKLILDKNKLRKVQKDNFKNVIHIIDKLTKRIDEIKTFLITNKLNYISKKNFKILHISNFGLRNNHRLFNLSISKKISSGFIRNGHDVIDFSYRDIFNRLNVYGLKTINEKIYDISLNYRPDFIVLGHNNVLSRENILKLKKTINPKISIWYEDHLAKTGPDYVKNITLLEKNHDLIDKYFVTTHTKYINSIIQKNKINFIPIPADENIENLHIYKSNRRYKDLFFALSHGVNFGKLKKNNYDERESFLRELISINNKCTFNILGIANEEPKWNYDFYDELSKCKMALNLSRGKPIKYTSSNRIASLVANGILTFIDKDTRFYDFFDENEMKFYKNPQDLLNQIENLKGDTKKINSISKNGKVKYLSIFNSKLVSEYILNKTFNIKTDSKFVWDK